MTEWNTDMDRAPKGKMVKVDRIVASTKAVRVYEEFQPDYVIIMSECRKVIKSYWLPDEARWAGFSKTEQPLAWMDWPKWSDEIAAHALELRSTKPPIKKAAEAAE